MNFVDEVEITVESGDGGAGCVSFRREARVPKGGPDGGDGGRGGDIVFKATANLNTLYHFRKARIFKSENGKGGQGTNKTGKSGRETVINVPVGTIFFDAETGLQLADLTEKEATWTAAKGGRGGLGNARFATSVRQAPRFAQPGEKGERRRLLLELKLLADVGLVGKPNAGKSTFLSKISSARPKIADYPFTTLVPQLGVVELSDERTLVVADIPGLIEGAHEGIGMGIEFLRHIERTGTLLFVIDANSDDPFADYQAIKDELYHYKEQLLDKKSVIALNKKDMLDDDRQDELLMEFKQTGLAVHAISALTGEGLTVLLEEVYGQIHCSE